MDKRVHVKVFCGVCGELLKHEALDPVYCKNFFKIQVDPCSDCLQGAYDRGFEDRFEHDEAKEWNG